MKEGLLHVRERAGSRVGKQLEDRSVGRWCATTTESEGAANPWEIVEKELVKRDYRTVLEAYGGTR